MTTLNGIDVSHYNRITDWGALSRAAGFVIAKATQGTTETDPTFAANRAQAETRRVPFGAYHFADGADPVTEARHFLSVAALKPGEVAFLDLEGPILKRADLVQWTVTWLTTVKTVQKATPLTYMSASVVKGHDWRPVVALGAGEWVAEYGPTSPPSVSPWPFAAIWQRTSTGRMPGIEGNVDLDTFYGDASAWHKYGDDEVTTPAPKPAPVPAVGTIEVSDYRTHPPVVKHLTDAEWRAEMFAYVSNASGRADAIAAHLGILNPDGSVKA